MDHHPDVARILAFEEACWRWGLRLETSKQSPYFSPFDVAVWAHDPEEKLFDDLRQASGRSTPVFALERGKDTLKGFTPPSDATGRRNVLVLSVGYPDFVYRYEGLNVNLSFNGLTNACHRWETEAVGIALYRAVYVEFRSATIQKLLCARDNVSPAATSKVFVRVNNLPTVDEIVAAIGQANARMLSGLNALRHLLTTDPMILESCERCVTESVRKELSERSERV